jgi:bifunctional non-homologous end joining protein LigD
VRLASHQWGKGIMPQGIEPSNLNKVFWPDNGLTKGDLIDYFDAVASFVVPAIRSRPLTVKRYPDGIDGFEFYQKNTPKYAPPWVPTVTLWSGSAKRDVNYTLCNSKRVLKWLANQACIELHPWLSRADHLDRPDHLVMDLDPPEENFDVAVRAAFVVRDVLSELGLHAVAKTSGAKGIHVYVPLRRNVDFDVVRIAAGRIAGMVEERIPDVATTAFKIADRGGRLYLDAGRNRPGAHVVAPYSPRARPGAPVSFPVAWSDLDRISPRDFTIRSVPDILSDSGDVWKDLSPAGQSLPSILTGEEEPVSPGGRTRRGR